jgi:hypothetical protein
MLLTILIVLLILALIGAIPGYSRWGYVSASPLVIIIVILLIAWAIGALR